MYYLLKHLKFRILSILFFLILGCKSDDEIFKDIGFIDQKTSVVFKQFDLKTINIFIDSLRTNYENIFVLGEYLHQYFGKIEAKAFGELDFYSGKSTYKKLQFDSMKFTFKINSFETNDNITSTTYYIYPVKNRRIHKEIIYTNDYELEYENTPLDTFEIQFNNDTVQTVFLNSLGKKLFDTLKNDTANFAYYYTTLAIVPKENSKSLVSMNLKVDSTHFTLYTSDVDTNLFQTKFYFNSQYFSSIKRNREGSALASFNDLDTFHLSNEYTFINSLFGVYTVVDFNPILKLLDNISTETNEKVLINKAEINAPLNESTTYNAVKIINYYFYRQNSGIKGEEIFRNSPNTAILTNTSYLSNTTSLGLLNVFLEDTAYTTDFTLFIEKMFLYKKNDEDYITQKLVITPYSFNNVAESKIDLNKVNVKVYYTTIIE